MGAHLGCNLIVFDNFFKDSLVKSKNFSYTSSLKKLPDMIQTDDLYIISLAKPDHRLVNLNNVKVIYKPSCFYFQGSLTQENQIQDGTLALPSRLPQSQDRLYSSDQLQFVNFKGSFKNNIPYIGTLSYMKGGQLVRDNKFSYERKRNRNTGKQQKIINIMLPNGVRYKGQVGQTNSRKFIITGCGQMTFSNGDRYIGMFYDGRIHGSGDFYYSANKHRYSGKFSQGKKSGDGRYYFSQSPKAQTFIQGTWKNDKIDEKVQVKLTLNGSFQRKGFWNNGQLLASNIQE